WGAELPASNKSPEELADPHPVYKAFTETPHSQTYAVDQYRDHALPTTYGLVKELDDHLGRLFAHLAATGQADNTLIVLASDHGDFYGDHWLAEKDLFHDPVTRIPLIIMDPQAAADSRRGTECDELVCAIDLLPTLVDWLGGTPQWQWLEGKSLLPALRTDSFKGHAYVVSECDYSALQFAYDKLGRDQYNARMTMVFDGRYKFIHCLGFAPMMFDLQTDPNELIDLGREPDYALQRAYMSDLLLDWSAGLKNRVTVGHNAMQGRFDHSDRRGILIGYWDQQAVPEALRPPASTGVS
ncbi:MAG: sulfatase-like hydrolase/transferase, partial [Gammaproteobacteria bacterium]|nr:sulfatase-like hydrolase/transferase [Gammaproteobacteria bacterium]